MKRSFIWTGLMAVIALAACQRESEVTTTPNPTYDPATNTVRTEFVLNISTSTGKDTKTAAQFAQVDSPFLGMDSVHLLAYKLPYSNADHGAFYYNPLDAEGNVIAALRDFDLGTLFPAGAVSKENASRSLELSLPLGTNAMLLYARALKTHSDDLQGKVFAKGNPSDLSSLEFKLSPRLSNHAAYEAGSFFFSRMLTSLLLTGVVNELEGGFWDHQTGLSDKSYAFWFPIPSDAVLNGIEGETPEESLAGLPANPVDQQTAVSEVDGNTYTFYRGQLSWKQLGTMHQYSIDGLTETDPGKVAKTDNPTSGVWMSLSALGDVLGDAYYVLTTIKSSGKLVELRAGSASAVLRIAEDLYSIVERCAGATPTSWEEQVAILLAGQLENKMKQFFQVSTGGKFDFLQKNGQVDVEQLKTNISLNCPPSDWTAYGSVVNQYLDASYFPSTTNEGFPVNIGLPVGGAIMVAELTASQQSVDRFTYTEDIPAYGFGTATFPIKNYRFPAELMYYGNSAIRVSSTAKTGDNFYPPTVVLWNDETRWGGWSSYSAVSSDTRSVAMINNINYGTALLESQVVYGDAKLYDNNKALHPLEEDNEITVSSLTGDKGIFVTGIVVGGQADVVGFDYLRNPKNPKDPNITYNSETGVFSGFDFSENPFDKMIYDKVLSSYKVGETTNPLYTMVWDNYDAEKAPDKQSDVYIGLELVNRTGQDLWGEMNLIRNGGTFYLLGKMDLATAVASARGSNKEAFTDLSRSYYCYPPYDPSTGNTINAPRVFMQDYKTTAKLVIGKDALKHAYMTVPDLRSGQVSLGLSIDMEWTPGLAFQVEMGWLQ